MLDSLRLVVTQLEADLVRQREEIDRLRDERNAYRKMLVEQAKGLIGGPEEWDQFNENDYTLNIDDLLAVLKK